MGQPRRKTRWGRTLYGGLARAEMGWLAEDDRFVGNLGFEVKWTKSQLAKQLYRIGIGEREGPSSQSHPSVYAFIRSFN